MSESPDVAVVLRIKELRVSTTYASSAITVEPVLNLTMSVAVPSEFVTQKGTEELLLSEAGVKIIMQGMMSAIQLPGAGESF